MGLKFDLATIVLPVPLVSAATFIVFLTFSCGNHGKERNNGAKREWLDISLVVFERRIQLRYFFRP